MKMMFRVETAYVAVLLVIAQMSAIHAVYLVCPEYQSKFAAINNLDQNAIEFKALLNETIADLTTHYMRVIGDSAEKYLPGASNETQHAIELTRSFAVAQINSNLADTLGEMDRFFAANETAIVGHLSDFIAQRCGDIEDGMRSVVAMLEYQISNVTNQRGPNAATPYAQLVVPADLNATVSAEVIEEHDIPGSYLFTAALESVYDKLSLQIKEHKVDVQASFYHFEQAIKAQATANGTSEIIRDDWSTVQDDISRLVEYKLPEINGDHPKVPEELTGDKMVNYIIDYAVNFYEDSVGDVNDMTTALFEDSILLEFDLKYSNSTEIRNA